MRKDEFSRKIITEFAALRTSLYVHRKLARELKDKRYKDTKKYVVAQRPTFVDCNPCLLDGETCHRKIII